MERASSVLCNKRIPERLKSKLYKSVVRPVCYKVRNIGWLEQEMDEAEMKKLS